MEELVSIIMPSYNTGDFISQSIESVLKQTYKNWELLIVDDCSTDNTFQVIRPFLHDSRIKIYKGNSNHGAAICRNKGLKEAKGRWIAFLDSDDLWTPDKLEKQIKFMKKNNYHFSYTNYEEVDSDGNRTGITISGPKKITRTGFFNYCWPGCLTVVYDKETTGLIQIVNIRKNNDYALWLKVSRTTDCYLLNECLAKYRKRKGSISNHGYLEPIKWHYILFRHVEGLGRCFSVVNTVRNIIFGIYKKSHYVKFNRNIYV